MIYTVTIEETVSEDFDIEAESIVEAKRVAFNKYKSAELVLEPGELISTKIKVRCNDTGETSEWYEL